LAFRAAALKWQDQVFTGKHVVAKGRMMAMAMAVFFFLNEERTFKADDLSCNTVTWLKMLKL